MTHVVDSLHHYYKITIDWEGNIYCVLTFDWDYSKLTMDIYIPGYIQKTLLKFKTPTPKNPEDALFKADPKKCRENMQFTKEEDGTPAISAAAIKLVQQNMGRLLFYGIDM